MYLSAGWEETIFKSLLIINNELYEIKYRNVSSFLVRGKHGSLLLLITNLHLHGNHKNYYLQYPHKSDTTLTGCTHVYNLLTKHTEKTRDNASCLSVY